MGRKTMRTGVNRQCTAQIIDMLMAKESNHPCPRPLLTLVEQSIEKRKDNRKSYSVNRECENQNVSRFVFHRKSKGVPFFVAKVIVGGVN